MADDKKKKKCLPHYGYDSFGGCVAGGVAFAPLYGPWSAISTGPKDSDGDHDGDEGAEEPGEEAPPPAAPPPPAPAPAPAGESRRTTLKALTEDLDYMAQVLGGLDPNTVPDMFFSAPLVGDPADDEPSIGPAELGVDLLGPEDLDGPTQDPDVIEASPFCAAITSVIHKNFTKAMDNMVIAGELDQVQRIDLSRCIGKALDAFTRELSTCDWADGMELSDSTKQAFSESISEDGPGEKKRLGHASDVMSAIKSDHELSKMAAQIKDLWAKWNEAEKSSVAGADLSPTAIRFREQMYGVVVKLKKLLTNKYIITHEVWADVKLVESYHYRLTDKETLEDAEEFLRIMNESVDRIRESDEDNLVLNAKEYASFVNDYGKIFDMFRSINFMLAHALARVHGDKPRTKAINKIMDDVHNRMKDLEKWYEVFNASIQESTPAATKVTEEDEQAVKVSYHDFDHVMKDVMSGKSMFWVMTYLKKTPITAKSIRKFASSGYTLLAKDKDGKGFRMQQGKSTVYVMPGSLWKSSAAYGESLSDPKGALTERFVDLSALVDMLKDEERRLSVSQERGHLVFKFPSMTFSLTPDFKWGAMGSVSGLIK